LLVPTGTGWIGNAIPLDPGPAADRIPVHTPNTSQVINIRFSYRSTMYLSSGGLGHLYMMRFVSALPNACPHHEFKGLRTNVQFQCPTSPLTVVDGKIKVATGPGLGVDLDPAYINKHQPVKA